MPVMVMLGLVWAVAGPAAPLSPLHVSPQGNDAWSGALAEPNAAKTDGPLGSLIGARDRLRAVRPGASEPVTVIVHGGMYRMDEPLVLEPRDSFTTYRAAEGERPVLSGGRVIDGWTGGADGVWSAQVPEGWEFRQLFVNGRRRTRARTPNEGWFTIAGTAPPQTGPAAGDEASRAASAFVYGNGEIRPWPNLQDVEVVVYHSWETSRLRIAEVDEASRVVSFTGKAAWPFGSWGPNQRYYVENAPDALDAPGEWYLDRAAGVVSYWPLPGEDLTNAEIVAPRLTRLVELRGDAAVGLPVTGVIFEGLTFHHQDWTLEPQGHSDAQAVWSVSAAIVADGAVGCAFTRCEVAHVGEYGVWFRRGCKNNRFEHSRVFDLGVGGIRIGETTMAATDALESSSNTIDNNHLYDGGHVYAGGVGLWVAQSSGNRITHNDIHDFSYSGMSIGWNWGDEPNRCHHNLIEHNHVHHVMNGQLNDGGAIYTLGVSPGSVIRGNVFHDVWPYSAIGWGIYLDATCGQYLVEDNLVYNVLSGGLMYHNGGHEHVIRNNVFAFSAEQMLWPYWERRPSTFERNILYFTQGDLLWIHASDSFRARLAAGESFGVWDRNLYWNPNDPDPRFFQYRFSKWQGFGLDRNSLVADPEFIDPARYDFRLRPTSPALKLGFEPPDWSEAGLYGDPEWVAEAKRLSRPPRELPPAPATARHGPIADDFEGTAVGAPPARATVSGEQAGASIRVTDEQAAGGQRSVKVTDSAGAEPAWQPHFFYQPLLFEGTVRESFDLWLTPGALLFTEWRDGGSYPGNVGPSVTFDARGTGGPARVEVAGKPLATIPVGEWVHVEIECDLGDDPARRWTLTIQPSGQPAERFTDLALTGNAFHELQWLGFVSTAQTDAVFYLDNLTLEPR